MSASSLFTTFKDAVAKHYGKSYGRMLIHTGVISWILSAAAQVAAIVINDKIPKEQKMFLIPQEMADAAVNILSFYTITQSFSTLSKQLVKTGKLLPKSVRTFLKNTDFKNIGKLGTNIEKDAKLPSDIAARYTKFFNGIDIIGTTIGTILSCNIVTPLARNKIAAHRQKKAIDRMNSKQKVSDINIENKTYLQRPKMADFGTNCRIYPNSGTLKI